MMIVVHIESGLGNQMLSYVEYLVLKKLHPSAHIYLETITYDIPEASEVINQWNGYELERIFGIHALNIKDVFSQQQWDKVLDEVRRSDFWDKNWNYPVYITRALNHAGLQLRNIRGDFESPLYTTRHVNMKKTSKPSLKERLKNTALGNMLTKYYRYLNRDKRIAQFNHYHNIFYKGSDNVFTGQWLGMKMQQSGIEFVDQEIRQAFQFPDWNSQENADIAAYLQSVNSVAIHARRGDLLGANGYCYKYGYFSRAVRHMRRHVENPVFVFFTDPGSVDWCKQNPKIFGLDFNKDKVLFVDWNKGYQSFRDMQLMAQCKHAIITRSSFGWWGAYFISNPGKITISPLDEIEINTTCHC